jgi:hypothetical protein
MIAAVASILRVLAAPWASRDHDKWVQVVTKVYVRGTHNRVVELELAPHNTAWWATQCALIALEDQRDTTRCRLLLRGRPLHPRRSLVKSGVRNGDTLDLVNAETIPRRRNPLTRLLTSDAVGRLGIHRR